MPIFTGLGVYEHGQALYYLSRLLGNERFGSFFLRIFEFEISRRKQ